MEILRRMLLKDTRMDLLTFSWQRHPSPFLLHLRKDSLTFGDQTCDAFEVALPSLNIINVWSWIHWIGVSHVHYVLQDLNVWLEYLLLLLWRVPGTMCYICELALQIPSHSRINKNYRNSFHDSRLSVGSRLFPIPGALLDLHTIVSDVLGLWKGLKKDWSLLGRSISNSKFKVQYEVRHPSLRFCQG